MKLLRACLLVVAVACTAQAGEIQFDRNSQAPSTGTALLLLLENILFSF